LGSPRCRFRRLKSLRLRNLPAYSGAVVVQEGIDQLSVVNVPHLSELGDRMSLAERFSIGQRA